MKKQNKRNKLARITLALLLILSMIGNTLILPAVAQENLAPTDETILPETPLDGTSDATGAATLPEPIQLTAADIPEFISAAALEERGAVERMRSEETNMSSVIFRNADGTRTMYMYGLPVKYTAADGTVRDKSTNLVSVSTASVLLSNQPVAQAMAQMSTTQRAALQEELGILDAERAATTLHMLSTALTTRGKSLSDMAYTTLDNDVYAIFPTNLAQGMTLVFGEHSVRMTPAGNGLTVTAGGNVTKTTTASLADSDVAERLLYPNVFGLGTAVQYTPTLTGVKEEILLSRNVGKNSFAFLLETGGLILTETNGQFTLVDPETEQTVGTLGEIIVFDSAGQIVRGNMTAQTILAGQKYGITISVDQEFLASATYPVSIDPSTDVYQFMYDSAGNLDIAIEDISLYNSSSCAGYTFVEWHQIGDVFDTNCRGQAVFRFPFLYDPNGDYEYYLLTASDISSFVLQLKSGMNTTSSNVLRASPYVPIWSDENNDGIYEQKIFSSQYYWYSYISDWDAEVNNVPSNATFSIDLTGFAKKWKDMQHGIITDPGDGLPETGVLLWNFEDEGNVWLESAGYSADLCVIMEYSNAGESGDFYMNNRAARTFLAYDGSLDMLGGKVSEYGPDMTWNVEYIGGGEYLLHPNGNENLCLNAYGNVIAVDPDEPNIPNQVKWTRAMPDGGGVIWTAYNGNVLAVNSNGNVVIGAPSQFSTEQMAWRMVDIVTYAAREVQSISVEDFFAVKEQATQILVAPSSNNALWTSYEDFSYTLQNYSSTTDNITSASISNTGVLTANNFGVATVTIVHKPTQVSTTAKVRIVAEYIINREISYNFDREKVASYIITYHEDYNDNYFDFSILFDFLGGDCTNFVSQCLHRAGIDFFNPPSSKAESGQKQQDPTSWYHIKDYCGLLNADGVSYTWSGAENFRLFWKDRCYEYVVYGSPDQFEADLEYWTNILKTGDVIQLMKNGTTANHSMIVQSVDDDTIYIAQHSKNRINHDIKDTLASSDITDTTCIVVMRIVND